MAKMVGMIALRSFSSTVWGNVEKGKPFSVAEGYVKALEEQEYAKRAKPLSAVSGVVRHLMDGPTVAEYVAAGHRAENYPPTGYESKSTLEEIAAAVAAQAEPTESDEDRAKRLAIEALQNPAPPVANDGTPPPPAAAATTPAPVTVPVPPQRQGNPRGNGGRR